MKTKVINIYTIDAFKEYLGVNGIDVVKGSSGRLYGSVQGRRVCGISDDAEPFLKTPEKLRVLAITDDQDIWYLIVPKPDEEVLARL